MKKVLFTATVDQHIKLFHIPYLKYFKENGYEVHVATNGDEEIPFCDIKHKVSFERTPIKINNIKAIKQLKKIIDRENFEIIHCHTPMGGVVTRIAATKARKNGTRVIYTAHGFHFYKGAPTLNWLIYYPIEKILSKYTDTIITINKEDYELAKKKFARRCHDIEYIPGIGIDISKFDIKLTNQEKIRLKQSLGLKKTDYILTCVARLDKNKNQGFLINMMDKLTKDNNNIHLLLVGPDELDGYYHKMAEAKKIQKYVHFLGRREDIPDILAITNIVVSASFREGLPVNVLEAFAAKKPVVALNCRGMSDLITHGENGFIINNSINDFVDAINIIYKNSNNYKFVFNIDNYSINNIIELLKKIYFE